MTHQEKASYADSVPDQNLDNHGHADFITDAEHYKMASAGSSGQYP